MRLGIVIAVIVLLTLALVAITILWVLLGARILGWIIKTFDHPPR